MTDKKFECRLIIFVVLILLLPFYTPHAVDVKGQDITSECFIRMDGAKIKKLHLFDRNYSTKWERATAKTSAITIRLPEETTQGGLYLCFAKEPQLIQVFQGESQEAFYREEGEGYAHRYISFCGNEMLRLEISGREKIGFSLSEMYVTSGIEPPDWVQIWQPQLDRADMLILVAHPDDELLWMGGAIPYYKYQMNLDIAVAYLTCANPLRRSEMLNGLWTAGIRHYPYVAGFRDKRMSGLKSSYELWGGSAKVEEYIAGLYRKLKPQVVLTHDLFGEYGHPAHIICANEAVNALSSAADSNMFLDSFARFETWDVPKLYLHLYGKHQIHMNWDKLMVAFGGKTSLDISKEAFAMHKSQKSRFTVSEKGPYSCSRFGLMRSLVGDDIEKDDFFENITLFPKYIGSE